MTQGSSASIAVNETPYSQSVPRRYVVEKNAIKGILAYRSLLFLREASCQPRRIDILPLGRMNNLQLRDSDGITPNFPQLLVDLKMIALKKI